MSFNVIEIEKLDIVVIDGDRGKNYPHKNELFNRGFCLFLTANNVTKIGFNFSDNLYITREKDMILRNGKLSRNDVVITTRGTLGNVAIYDYSVPYDNVRINSGMLILRCGKEFGSKFLYYVLNNNKFMNQIKAIQSGTAQPQLPKSHLIKMKIPYPPLETQKKIAAVLSALDDKIELNNAINKNLEEQAQAIYKRICLKARFAPLSELIEIVESGSRPKGGAKISGIPSIGAEKIDGFGRYDYSNEKFIDINYFNGLKRGIVFSGDVMLYKDGAYTGKSSMALDGFPHEICAVNEHVFLLRTKDNRAQFFLYFTLRNEDVYKKIHALACGKAAQPGLNQKELMCVTSFLPEEEVIQEFESVVSPMMHFIALNALENKKLGEIRDALLPRLMSGEIDVSAVKI